MKLRRLALLTALTLIPPAAVGIASAKGPSGVTAVEHVVAAQLRDDIKTNADGVKFRTKVPTEVSVLTLTIDPGGSTGWHTHPGLAIISVSEGAGKLYSTNCKSKKFRPGDAFIEAGNDKATLFRNEGSRPVVLTVTFIAPRKAAIIEPAPASCGLS